MSRLPPLTRDELQTDEQRDLFDYMDKFTKSYFDEDVFRWREPNGAFLGPFAPFLHTPTVGRAQLEVVLALAKIPGLSKKARETSILVTGTKYQAAYELYAHRRNAVAEGGLTQDEVDAICTGERPASLDAHSATAYDVTKELLECAGPLSDSTWSAGCEVLGREGMTALVHYVGVYAWVCMILNGFDCKLPKGERV